MNLIQLNVATTTGEIELTAEKVTEHFALSPMISDGGLGRGAIGLTHIPTGRRVTADQVIDLRKVAVALEDLDINWDGPVDAFSDAERDAVAKTIFAARTDDTLGWPWPKWAGDETRPTEGVLAGVLDESLRFWETRDHHKNLIDQISAHAPDVANQLDGQLMFLHCRGESSSFGLIWLLAVLHRLDAEAAARASRFLVDMWEQGDTVPEWVYEWRAQLATGDPLRIPGFPHVDEVFLGPSEQRDPR